MVIDNLKNNIGSDPVGIGHASCLPQITVEPANFSFSVGGLRVALGLAAAPVFAGMALISNIYQDEFSAICMSGSGAFSLTGMVWMYLLMSMFHVGAWLRLFENQRPQSKQLEN